MFNWKKNKIKYHKREKDIDPDEIFVDSSNLPNFDIYQFEGRLEKPISRRSIFILCLIFSFLFLTFIYQSWNLQILNGQEYFKKSENNRLRNTLVFSQRGIIYDRTGTKLAWNTENPKDQSLALRKYINLDGLGHVLGYLKYPQKDKYGFYFSEVYDGKDGIEKYFNTILSGQNGKRVVEVDALGDIQSENIIYNPIPGENITLSIDASIQTKMYQEIKKLADSAGFAGGAGVMMNIHTGEVLALTSFPEFNSQILTDGQDVKTINSYLNNKNNSFLNRVINGLYAPGSIVKPFMAYAALAENIIDPYTNILSTEYITIPNIYDPSKPTIFRDWKAHGYVDMKKALAVSSDIYFYTIGGGYEKQKGLGILNIDKYMKLFGLGEPFASGFFLGAKGVIPTPEWKKENFAGEEWRVGNTYHTSIGQYGFQVSPLQMVRAISAVANGGKLIEPTILLNSENFNNFIDLDLNPDYLKIVKDGMRDAVIKDYGTVKGLNSSNYSIAGKTGTAEIGVYKQFVNSWVIGFYPYEKPKYAFALIMEKGPVKNLVGATSVMRQVMDYIAINKPEYLE